MLDNQVALVTGATRGIGKAIAESLAEMNALVIGTATSEKGAEQIDHYFADQKIKGKGLVLNVTDPNSINTLMKTIVAEYQTPTILVNNAGITRDNLLMRMKEDEWQSVLDTNLSSIFRMSKACLRGMMKARQGCIINIASVVGSSGNAGQTNYSAAKAGILGFTKSLAREVGSRNITVNAVAPGFIDTDMTQNLAENQKKLILDSIALNRLGSPKEIAATVAFLASPNAGYITGETIHINGGMYMS